MITISVGDYTTFKAVVAELNRGRPTTHILSFTGSSNWTAVAIGDNPPTVVSLTLSSAPSSFSTDYRDAVSVSGVSWS